MHPISFFAHVLMVFTSSGCPEAFFQPKEEFLFCQQNRCTEPMGEDYSRHPMQGWTEFPAYLKEEHWMLVQGPERELRKIEGIVGHLIDMGMRHPTESTSALLACLVAPELDLVSDNLPRLHDLLQTVKSVVRTKVLRAKQLQQPPPGGNYVISLPNDPQFLDPAIRAACFAQGFFPPPATFDLVRRTQRARTMPLRKTHRSLALEQSVQNAPLWPALPQGISMPMGPMAALAYMHGGHAWQGGNWQGPHVNFQINPLASASSSGAAAPQTRMQRMLTAAGLEAERRASTTRPEVPQPPLALEDIDRQQAATEQQPLADLPPTQPAEPAEVLPANLAEGGVEQPKLPNKLAASVSALAAAEYGQQVSLPPKFNGDEDMDAPAVRRKPAAKLPAASKAATKKPSAKLPAKALQHKGKETPSLKRPAAAFKKPASKSSSSDAITRAAAIKLRPQGCSRCRGRAGCTPSCWKGRGKQLI